MSYQHQIIGTIIASVLNYDQLCKEIGDNPAIDNKRSSYAPCDGRSISGSRLELQTNHSMNSAPDLRGKFIRGLNEMYSPGEPAGFDPQKTGDLQANRVVMDYQVDAFASHNHGLSYYSGVHWDFPSDEFAGAVKPINAGQLPIHGAPTSYEGITEETRPRNRSVYFYIKIN